MSNQLKPQDLDLFFNQGYFCLSQPHGPGILERVLAAANRLRAAYPYGFDHSEGFGSTKMLPRAAHPVSSDRSPTIIYHNAGFLEPDLLLPLHNPVIYETIERVVGKDFYLSNVWLQVVPANTRRLGYHKDEHGSVSITMPLDSIGWNSGSTCVVPGSHRNTPPPSFCMPNVMLEHEREAQLTGEVGDVVFFTPETWHGRAANLTNEPTCRLFFNFYSRTSRDSTRWSPSISNEKAAEVAEIVPLPYRHMFRIDPPGSKTEAKQSGFKAWVMENGSSSAASELSVVLREYFYWKYALKAPVGLDARGIRLPSYRTTITSSDRFTFLEYVSHLHATRTAKNIVRSGIDYWSDVFGRKKQAVRGGE